MDILVPAWIDGQLQPVEKLQTHLRGLRHKAVSVFVMRDAETLLQRRALSKYHTPGLWANACCINPEWGETGFDCAQRRLEEELGLAGQVPVYRDTVEYRADVGGGMIEHEVVEIYTLQVEQIDIHPNPEEVMDYRWQNLTNLNNAIAEEPEIFTPWLKITSASIPRPYLASKLDNRAGRPVFRPWIAQVYRHIHPNQSP